MRNSEGTSGGYVDVFKEGNACDVMWLVGRVMIAADVQRKGAKRNRANGTRNGIPADCRACIDEKLKLKRTGVL